MAIVKIKLTKKINNVVNDYYPKTSADQVTFGSNSTVADKLSAIETTLTAHAVTNKGSAFSNGLYKITTNSEGHITNADVVTKDDITDLGIPGSDTNTTYSAGTGLSLSGTTFNHSNSITAGTAKGDDSKTLTFGGTFTIPTLTYDAQGHITSKGTVTMTMPANPNSNTTYTIASGDSNGQIKVTPSSGSAYNVDVKGLGTAAYKAITDTYSATGTDAVSGKAVASAIASLPEPMVFKGSLGTGGTITALPTNGTATVGDTYKVITAGTYASKAAEVGDTFICLTKTANANTWELIPSGDEPSGTVTSITITATSPISIDNSEAITTSGTRTISHATSGVTAGTYTSVTVDNKGHVTAGSNPTTLAGYGITDASASNHTHPAATQSAAGLMSAADKEKLDGINIVVLTQAQYDEFDARNPPDPNTLYLITEAS